LIAHNLIASTETQPPLISFTDSSSSTIAMIALRFMAYAELGEATWKFFWLGPHCFLSPVFFHGFIYSFSTKRGLLQLKIKKNQNSLIEYKIETLIAGPSKRISIRDVKCYFLVECDGQLLASCLSNLTRSRQDFRIFMVVNRYIRESAGDSDKIFLLPVKNLNNYAIFIHPWFPGISIPADRFPCFLPNFIYFYK
jgi:hypothetical protein